MDNDTRQQIMFIIQELIYLLNELNAIIDAEIVKDEFLSMN
jgi:hypothetical protein